MKTLHQLSLVAFLVVIGNSIEAQDDSKRPLSEQATFVPDTHHSNIKGITLFAENPEIVTPIGVAVAPDGRVFVQENHTHKRNSNYKGPKTDRILIFEDTDNDGVADKRSVFYEGHTFSTDLLFGPDGHLYVSTRWFVGRFRDAATRQKANGEPEKLVACETDGDYPHNGVGGLAIDPAEPEWLAFGFGENLGADYTFVGTDGVRLSGGAEGGSTYRCRTDGSSLTRQSTGHWNAFGMAFDLDGHLFSTDNDPNATPPNRLLHIIPGADFGYEYRYGRSGRHPLVAWYGENPGTLGMIGALGEAACGLVPYGPGRLLSASWTDNRVDLHLLAPKGASFGAKREPFLSGPNEFRPVHFSYSPDGRFLYITDWVKISYPVHGHGRIWRIEFNQPVQLQPLPRDATPQEMAPLDALTALGSDDPYVRTHAIESLTKHPEVLADHPWTKDSNAIARAHYAIALKRVDASRHADIIPALLADDDPRVRFVGIKWIADEILGQYQPSLEKLLARSDLSRGDLSATLAAIARISSNSTQEFSPDDMLIKLALDTNKPSAVRAMALQSVDVANKQLTVDVLASLADSDDLSVKREAVRSLTLHSSASRESALAKTATDESLDNNLRADAIAGLTSVAAGHADLLNTLAASANPVIANEARRTQAAGGLVVREVEAKPPANEIGKWVELLDHQDDQADAAVGRRLFYHSALGGCYKCHAMNGRGSSVGPDLTTIRNQSDVSRDWILRHIVDPNVEIAPYYRPQQLLTVDGQVFTGLVIGKEGQLQNYVGINGDVFQVDKDDVEERRELSTSIMPSGLLDAMSAKEIRDLIAYLLTGDETL